MIRRNTCGTKHAPKLLRRANLAVIAVAAVCAIALVAGPIMNATSAPDHCRSTQAAASRYSRTMTADIVATRSQTHMLAETRVLIRKSDNCRGALAKVGVAVRSICTPCARLLATA
jgi:hypothetical protein